MARRRRKSFDDEIRQLEKRLGLGETNDEFFSQYDEVIENDVVDESCELMSQDDEDVMSQMVDEMDYVEEEPLLEDFVDEEDVVDVFDEEPELMGQNDDDDLVGVLYGSEESPGVEDEITQDYLSEVEEEENKQNIPTEPSVKDAKVARFVEASRRLDRVATYFEKSGRKDLALRIDKLSTALDIQRSKFTK